MKSGGPPDANETVWRARVDAAQAGELIAFLAEAQGLSRRGAKHLLDERRVFVNARRVWMARHRLRAGDLVEVQPATSRPVQPMLPVLGVAEPYVIVNKPAGWTSKEGPHSVEALWRRASGEPDWTAVHRLDRDTTGCLLLARTPAAADRMIPLFREREVEKIYWALAVGDVPPALRRIAEPIEGEPAVTWLRVLGRGGGITWIEVRIETGRTHQIRRHLTAAGFPIAGDRTYGASRALNPALRALPRQMLHARRLAFTHPYTGAAICAEAPMPEDFLTALRLFGIQSPVR